jgi:hypothetical protein
MIRAAGLPTSYLPWIKRSGPLAGHGVCLFTWQYAEGAAAIRGYVLANGCQ